MADQSKFPLNLIAINKNEQIKKFFLLTSNQIIVAGVLAVIVIVIQYTPMIFRILDNSQQQGDYLQQLSSQYVSSFYDTLNAIPLGATLITGLTWGLAGLVLYTIFYLLSNAIVDARNEIIYAANNSAEGAPAGEVLRHAGTKLITIVGYILFVGSSVFVLFGFWLNLVGRYLLHGLHMSDAPFLLLGAAGLAINFYLLYAFSYLIWKYNEASVAY